MAARTETRFGEATSVGTSYTSVATIPAATVANILLNLANRMGSTIRVRAYVADNSWTTGEPTGGTLKAAICYDLPCESGEVRQVTGIVCNAGERIVVRSDTATSLDVLVCGVALT